MPMAAPSSVRLLAAVGMPRRDVDAAAGEQADPTRRW
jgi:hypothetical protein